MSLSNNDNNIHNQQFSSDKDIVNKTKRYAEITLDKNSIFNINLNVIYGKSISSENIVPISAATSVNGFWGGYKWEASKITINTIKQQTQIHYLVSGIIAWKIFRLNIYSQKKQYQGVIAVK